MLLPPEWGGCQSFTDHYQTASFCRCPLISLGGEGEPERGKLTSHRVHHPLDCVVVFIYEIYSVIHSQYIHLVLHRPPTSNLRLFGVVNLYPWGKPWGGKRCTYVQQYRLMKFNAPYEQQNVKVSEFTMHVFDHAVVLIYEIGSILTPSTTILLLGVIWKKKQKSKSHWRLN